MTDREKIRGKIENWFNICLKRAKIFDADYWNAKADAYRNVLWAFDELPEESLSEDLEKAAQEYVIPKLPLDPAWGEYRRMSYPHFTGHDIMDAFEAGANWQKEHMPWRSEREATIARIEELQKECEK